MAHTDFTFDVTSTNMDARIYRKLIMYNTDNNGYQENYLYPYYDYGTFGQDWFETPTSIEKQIEYIMADYGEDNMNDSSMKTQINALKKKKQNIVDWLKKESKNYFSFHSLVHPYAVVRLAGACGSFDIMESGPIFDRSGHRRFYEIEGGEKGGYAKVPTTTTLIQWSNEDEKGRYAYSFQDFVFCKHWNKIENNRLITLRRYAAPVTDNIEFADYDVTSDTASKTLKGKPSNRPFSPLATAVTYFGEGTDNKLSDILAFSAKYNWESINKDDNHPINVSVEQADNTNLTSTDYSIVSSGLDLIGKVTGFLGATQYGGSTIDPLAEAGATPPDPYSDGPYENRILGPINVIMDTYKRKRGLKFTGDGLKIKFSYVARPIAGINNKAVLLDLLANMLVLTYSSGSWFGGMWRFNNANYRTYNFKYGDAMNELYKGNLFGKNGAPMLLTKTVWSDLKNYATTFLPDLSNVFKNMWSALVNGAQALINGGNTEAKDNASQAMSNITQSGIVKSVEKHVASKVLKGASIPYITGQKALLTGNPVGDWHLTIGNPLNPIAMIGNLIVDDVQIEFNDELGPDDFPTGFTATVSLKHGLGRDRDAIESMFNRGMGRIYTLPDTFRSTADGETKVDEFTGGVNTDEGRVNYDETYNTYFGGGRRFIGKIQQNSLKNAGEMWDGSLGKSMIEPIDTYTGKKGFITSTFVVNPWQMGVTL